jgi:hypothetical protein
MSLSFARTEGMETDTRKSTMDLDSLKPGTFGIHALSLGYGVPFELSSHYCNCHFTESHNILVK